MDAFGAEYTGHNLPLLFVSGLGSDDGVGKKLSAQEGGFRVKTDLPDIETNLADVVREAIAFHDGSAVSWAVAAAQSRLFSVRHVGRVGPIPSSPTGHTSYNHLVLHSTAAQSAASSALSQDVGYQQQWRRSPSTSPPHTALAIDTELAPVSRRHHEPGMAEQAPTPSTLCCAHVPASVCRSKYEFTA
jgi:hypothetical protein